MSYVGQKATVPLGQGGLSTDLPPSGMPLTALIRAQNVTLERGLLEKDPGIRRWNRYALGAGVLGFYDYWPDPYLQRAIVALSTGNLVRLTNIAQSAVLPPASGAEATLSFLTQPQFIEGGQEVGGAHKKLFVISGGSPIQVLEGDATTRRNLAKPALDWGQGKQPTCAILFNKRFWCFQGHRAYASAADNHEDFQTSDTYLTMPIYPGEGEEITAAWVYASRLFVAKKPYGIYYLDETESFFTRLTNSYGVASAHSAIDALSEMYIANTNGTITSAKAAFQLGDIESADVVRGLGCERFFHDTFLEEGRLTRWAAYDEARKRVYFSYQSRGSSLADSLVILDLNQEQPRLTVSQKGTMSCLGMMKNNQGLKRPFAGSTDGFLYEMDCADRAIRTSVISPYEMIVQTPNLDLGVPQDKLFDFIELDYLPTGAATLTAQVYIDGVYKFATTFKLGRGEGLDGTFQLDKSRLVGSSPYTQTRQLFGRGRTISVVLRHAGQFEDVKLQALRFLFRPAGEDAK